MFRQLLKNNFKYAQIKHESMKGRDLYYPKFGNSFYEYNNYEIKKRVPYDGQPQITNVNIDEKKIDYDCENKKWT